MLVDIGVVYIRDEPDLRRNGRIVFRELNIQQEDAIMIGRVFRPVQGHLPCGDVILAWEDLDIRMRILNKMLHFFYNALESLRRRDFRVVTLLVLLKCFNELVGIGGWLSQGLGHLHGHPLLREVFLFKNLEFFLCLYGREGDVLLSDAGAQNGFAFENLNRVRDREWAEARPS